MSDKKIVQVGNTNIPKELAEIEKRFDGVRILDNPEAYKELCANVCGSNMKSWRFKCPGCKSTQSWDDFKKFTKLDDETIDKVIYFSCIGRWNGELWGCDYSSGGLFVINQILVIVPGKGKMPVFEPSIEEFHRVPWAKAF